MSDLLFIGSMLIAKVSDQEYDSDIMSYDDADYEEELKIYDEWDNEKMMEEYEYNKQVYYESLSDPNKIEEKNEITEAAEDDWDQEYEEEEEEEDDDTKYHENSEVSDQEDDFSVYTQHKLHGSIKYINQRKDNRWAAEQAYHQGSNRQRRNLEIENQELRQKLQAYEQMKSMQDEPMMILHEQEIKGFQFLISVMEENQKRDRESNAWYYERERKYSQEKRKLEDRICELNRQIKAMQLNRPRPQLLLLAEQKIALLEQQWRDERNRNDRLSEKLRYLQ